jgi:CheY-like chemotaxis protein
MKFAEQSGRPARALEITVALAGRRFGLCGFDTWESQRISKILCDMRSVALVFDEGMLSESARLCDATLIKLARIGPEGLRVAATSTTPILVAAASQVILEGVGAAYCWPRDILNEPWSEAELLVRLFRLLASPESGHTAPAPESTGEPLVLLADDDPELIALVGATLRNGGITCRTAGDGLAALRLTRELVPDLILLDVRMPGMDGFEVLETIRRDPRLQTIPVILLTACDNPTDIIRGAELNANDYLGKPVSPNLLVNRVNRLLSARATQDRRPPQALLVSAGLGDKPGGSAAAGAVEQR